MDNVIIVQHQDEITRCCHQLLEQGNQKCFCLWLLRGLDGRKDGDVNFNVKGAQGPRSGRQKSAVGRCCVHPATIPGRLFANSLNSVVLPKPAGAEMTVSLRLRPACNRSISSGRGASSARTGGT